MRAMMTAWLAGLAGTAAAQVVDLASVAPGSPFSGSLGIEATAPDGARATWEVTLDLPHLLDEIDAQGAARGNFGSEQDRLFWVGPTQPARVEAAGVVVLTTRARYESWVTGLIKTRLFEITRDVEIRLSPVWDDDATALRLDVEVIGIRDFPNDVEDLLHALGVSFGTLIPLFAVEDEVLRDAGVRIVPMEAEATGREVRLRFEVSADEGAAMRLLMSRLPDLDPGAALDRFGRMLVEGG